MRKQQRSWLAAACSRHIRSRLASLRPVAARNFAGFAQSRELASEFVGERDRRRHQLRGFIAGKAEHQTLITSALLRSGFPIGCCFIDPLLNVARLLAHFADHPAGVGVKNAIAVYVPNVANGVADLLLKIKFALLVISPASTTRLPLQEFRKRRDSMDLARDRRRERNR